MYPWIWLWAPQLYFPWSGSVAQKIEPNTSWFFDAIDPRAGNGQIERKACEIASYGRQLGLITEVLLESTNEHGSLSSNAEKSRQRLVDIQARIERVKDEEAYSTAADFEERLVQLRNRNPEEFALLTSRLQRLISNKFS
ncbi:MAG: hypothetical protein U1F34_04305 [Gammaproteobacteria bacterium]